MYKFHFRKKQKTEGFRFSPLIVARQPWSSTHPPHTHAALPLLLPTLYCEIKNYKKKRNHYIFIERKQQYHHHHPGASIRILLRNMQPDGSASSVGIVASHIGVSAPSSADCCPRACDMCGQTKAMQKWWSITASSGTRCTICPGCTRSSTICF